MQTLTNTHLAVLPAASKDQTRMVMNGVHINESGVSVATDGRVVFACIPDKITADELRADCGVIIPNQAAKALVSGFKAKGSSKAGELTRGDTNPNAITVNHVNGSGVVANSFDAVPGHYPAWLQVMPRGKAEQTITLGLPVLKALVSVLDAANKGAYGKGAHATLEIFDDTSPVRVTVSTPDHTGKTIVGAMMPMRDTAKDPNKGFLARARGVRSVLNCG